MEGWLRFLMMASMIVNHFAALMLVTVLPFISYQKGWRSRGNGWRLCPSADRRAGQAGQELREVELRVEPVPLAVSGRAKPARTGRVKTSHLRRTRFAVTAYAARSWLSYSP
jgi:hypothetical protein